MTSSTTFMLMAVRSVFRNRQKTLTSVMGIILAVTLIFGEIISLEMQSGAVMQHEMDKVDTHFRIWGNSDSLDYKQNFQKINENLSSIDGIEEFYFSMDHGYYVYSDYPSEDNLQIGLRINDIDTTDDHYYSFRGELGDMNTEYRDPAPQEGGVAIPWFLNNFENLSVGQEISISLVLYTSVWDYENGTENLTVKDVIVNNSYAIESFSEEPYYFDEYDHYKYDSPGPDRFYYYEDLTFNGMDYLDLLDSMTSYELPNGSDSSFWFNFHYSSRVDPDVYKGHSTRIARENLDVIRDEIDEYVTNNRWNTGFDLDFRSEYEEAFDNTESYFRDARWEILALSIPLILFGLYLGFLGTELFLSERRREIGVLKARGATNKQLTLLLVMESVYTGAFAGGVGIFIAGFGAKILMSFTQASSYIDLPWYDPGFSSGTFLFAIGLGVLLMVSASYQLFRRITKLEAGELLSRYSEKGGKPYARSKDIKLLILAVVSLAIIRFQDPLEEAAYLADNEVVEIFAALIFELIIPLMIILAPYIVIFSGIRIATRGSKKFFAKLADTAGFITGELGYLVKKNILSGKRRIVNLTTVLSVLFAFLILTSTFYHAEEDKEIRTLKTEIGADIKVTLDDPVMDDSIEMNQREIGNITGVDRTSPLITNSIEIERIQENKDKSIYSRMYQVDAVNYSRICYFDEAIFSEGGEGDIKDLVSGGVMISEDLRNRLDKGSGDSITLRVRMYDKSNSYYQQDQYKTIGTEILGVMKTVPGLMDDGEFYYDDDWVLMDWRYFSDRVSEIEDVNPDLSLDLSITARNYVIETDEKYEDDAIAKEIAGKEELNVRDVRVTSTELDEIRTEPYSGSSLLVLRTQLGLVIFISFLATGGIIFISSREKKLESATIALKGTTGKQVLQLEMGEALVVLIYSLIIGTIAGLFSAWTWIFVFNSMDIGDVILRSYWPSITVIPVVLIMCMIFLGGSLIMAYNLRKTDLTSFLRWGG